MKHSLKQVSLLLALTAIIAACNNETQKFNKEDLSKFDPLLGNWASMHDQGNLFENWHKDSNNIYYGESFLIADADTVYKTKFIINYKNGAIYKHIENKSIRKQYSVDYKLISIAENKLVFQNDSISYPKTVSYKFTDNEGLIIDLDGMMEKQPRHDEFVYVLNHD